MLKRRAFLILLVAAVLCATLNLSGARAASDRITIGTTEVLDTLDPAESGDVFTWELLTHLYTGLTRQIPGTLDYELALAESHAISPDGLTHTFTIRADATFNDGTPITASVFSASIQRALSLDGGGGRLIATYVESVSSDAASNTLAFRLIRPLPFVEQLVALPPFFPLHPATFDADRITRQPKNTISNGVYRVGEFRPRESLTLVADPAWKGAPPATPTIVIRHYDYAADLREAIRSGAVDLAWRGMSYEDVELALKSDGVRLETAPGLQSFYMVFGIHTKPFNDPITRQGISYLLDRDRTVRVALRDTATSLYALVPPTIAADGAAFPAFDVAAGEAILTSGKYSRYNRIQSEMQFSRWLYGQLNAEAINSLGINITRHPFFSVGLFDTVPDTFLDQIERGNFRWLVVGLTPVVPHPDAYLRPLLASDGLLASGGHFANAEIDAVLAQASTADAADQQALYQQVQQIATTAYFALPLWQMKQLLLARESVQGVVIEPNYLLRYASLRNG